MGKIITMDYINQSGRWPTGCESVSAVMVLNYLGVLVTVDEFIEKFKSIDMMIIEELSDLFMLIW